MNEYDVARDYYQAIILKDGDEVINAEEVIGTQSILYVTEQGMCLNSVIDSIPVQGRKASGVKGINLNDGDRVLFASQVDCEGEIIAITDTGYAKRIICATIELSQRYRKGISIYKLTGRQGQKLIFSGYVKTPYDLALLINDTDILKLNTEDISLESRTSVGRELIKDKDKRITDVIIKAENI